MCMQNVVEHIGPSDKLLLQRCTNGFFGKGFKSLQIMQLSGVKSDSVNFASVLAACATVGALDKVMSIHQIVAENVFH